MAGAANGVAATVALGALSEGLVAGYGAFAGGSGADLLVAQGTLIRRPNRPARRSHTKSTLSVL